MDPGDITALQEAVEDLAGDAVLARRAKIVLLCKQGLAPAAVARQLGCNRRTVVTWRERFRQKGLDGLRDAPRRGRPVTLDPAVVVVRTLQAPRDGSDRWSTRQLAAELGISNVTVGTVWRRWGIRPEPAGRVALLTEPVLDTAIIDVLGLFVTRSTIVFAVAVGEPRRRAGSAIGLGRAVSGLLTTVAARQEPDDPPLPLEFLDRLEVLLHRRAAQNDRGAQVRLLVQGDDTMRRLALTLDAVTAHVIPSHLAWDRIVRVGCLIAGADEDGAASVQALRAAIAGHQDRGAFGWVRAACERRTS